MKELLDEIQRLQEAVIENTQCECVLALMLSESIDFRTATTKLQLSSATAERIRTLIKNEVVL